MKPRLEPKALRETSPTQYLLRFAFGGVVTALAGYVSHVFGPAFGGLLLAFPAILPATLTLVKQESGDSAAVDDARGARLGAVALVAFAAAAWLGATRVPAAINLLIALCVWLVLSGLLWRALLGRN